MRSIRSLGSHEKFEVTNPNAISEIEENKKHTPVSYLNNSNINTQIISIMSQQEENAFERMSDEAFAHQTIDEINIG